MPYIVAVVSALTVLAMTAPALALGPFVAVSFVFAVLLAAILGGGKPGLVCTLTAVGGWHLVFGRGLSLATFEFGYLLGLFTYLIIGGVISFLCEALMRAWRRLTERQRQLEKEVEVRRRAEEASEERAERLRVTLSSIGDAVITTDTESRITNINGVAQLLTGWSAEEALMRPLPDVFRIIHEYSREPVENPCEKVLLHGTVVGLANHTLLIARDGREIPIEDSAAPIRDDASRLLGVVLVFRDASREREATAALQQLASIVEHSEDAILSKTIEGKISSWNRAAARLYGYQASEAIGQSIELIVPDDRRVELRQIMQQLAAGERIDQLDTIRRRKDGSLVHVSLQISPIRDSHGEVTGASIIARDISERKWTEESLAALARASTELASFTDRPTALRRALESVVPFFADWCIAFTENGDAHFQDLVAYHRDGQKQAVLNQVVQGWRDWGSDSPTRRAMQTGTTQRIEHFTDERLSRIISDPRQLMLVRELRPRSVLSVPVMIRNRTIGAIGFVVSESSRRYTERDVRFAEDLAKRLATAIENAELLDSLQVAHRQKDEFLAMLAHELRNPLAAIRYANTLIPLTDADAQPDLLALIDRQVQNLSHLIDGLLDVSRISRDKIQLKKEFFDAAVLLRRVSQVLLPQMEAKGHQFTCHIESEPLPLHADMTRVEQILTNVLVNAIKYTPEGGQIHLSAATRGDQVEIKVKDSGMGISKEMLPRVFELFAQAEQGLDRSQGGLGIGLTIARKLTEIHGGTMMAESPGLQQGAVFTIRLPLVRNQVTGERADNGRPTSLRRPLRLLIVDDNQDSVRVLALLLQSQGHAVETAHDGPTAVTLAQEFRPDGILLDLGLPKMNGYDVARTLRSQGFTREVIVAISGYGRPEDRRQSEAAGFDDHFTKPVSCEALLKLLYEKMNSKMAADN